MLRAVPIWPSWQIPPLGSPPSLRSQKVKDPAELSGDGMLDVVVANRGGGLWYPANSSWVLLGAGDGRLRNVTPPSYTHARLALAVADLDGDGDRDVLFLNELSGTGGIGHNGVQDGDEADVTPDSNGGFAVGANDDIVCAFTNSRDTG